MATVIYPVSFNTLSQQKAGRVMVTLNDGTRIMALQTSNTSILFKKSIDDGATWSDLHTLAFAGYSLVTVAMDTDGTQVLMLVQATTMAPGRSYFILRP